MHIRRLASLVFVGLAILSPALAIAAGSSCVTCHTNEGALKTLFVPPSPKAEEGEG